MNIEPSVPAAKNPVAQFSRDVWLDHGGWSAVM